MDAQTPSGVTDTASLRPDLIVPDRERLFRKFAEAYRATDRFSGICPDGCTLCEERESVMLLPYESEFIRSQLAQHASRFPPDFPEATLALGQCKLKVGYVPPDVASCPMLDPITGLCTIYPARPFDCRSFPLVPVFRDDGGIDFKLARYCPIATKVSDAFIRVTKEMWEMFREDLPFEWRMLYNGDSRKHTGSMMPAARRGLRWMRPPSASR